jgi:hypothetical protein
MEIARISREAMPQANTLKTSGAALTRGSGYMTFSY